MTQGARGTSRPGLHDVARAAGVSHQTVSRVLNAHPQVADETRARVERAISELGYRRNLAARALVTRKSGVIGVITSGSSHWGPSTLLLAVEQTSRDAGYYVSVASIHALDADSVRAALDHLNALGVDGIVAIAPEAAVGHIAELFHTRVPVVLVAAGVDSEPGVQVTSVDQELGARRAVRHLIELGHRRIAHLAGPAPWFDAASRELGWRRELRAAGLRPGRLVRGDWSPESGHRAYRTLLRTGLPTAVFAANDLMAMGLIRALHDGGVAVPGDVSVVGFDDLPGTGFLLPGLTTVRQDLESLGRQCLSMLIREMEGDPEPGVPIAPTLVVRESTAPPRPA